jgi:hypothetical protein
LSRHYEKARVEAEKTDPGFTVKTENIQSLRLQLPDFAPQIPVQVAIDGQTLKAMPNRTVLGTLSVFLERKSSGWLTVLPQKLLVDRLRQPRKEAGLQGPIDDAFMNSFVCVRGTGKAWHAGTQAYVEGALGRFQDEWNKYLRGELPIKDDDDLSEEDISGKHLILFGDPSSNSVLGQVLDRLPLRWNKESIAFAGKNYPAAEHVPVLIYPNPLNAARYVVLNTGHTFHAADFRGTNALLYPRLGDYAVLKLAPSAKDALAAESAVAGLFDDLWQIPGR